MDGIITRITKLEAEVTRLNGLLDEVEIIMERKQEIRTDRSLDAVAANIEVVARDLNEIRAILARREGGK